MRGEAWDGDGTVPRFFSNGIKKELQNEYNELILYTVAKGLKTKETRND